MSNSKNPNLPNVNKFATGITESLFANYKTGESLFKQAQSTENFVIQSALYQNKNTPLFAAQREADALMATKQRRPMVFEYVKSLNPTTKEPIWESITMYINPEQMSISTQKIKSKQVTRGGIYYHHWGDDHWAVSLSGTTGFSGMKGIEVLERVYHNSGTLLRYQAAGPIIQYPTSDKELDSSLKNQTYKVISFNSVTDLLKQYINDKTGKAASIIKKDIKDNKTATSNNVSAINDYESQLAARRDVLNKKSNKQRFVDSISYNNLEKMTFLIDQMREFEWYNNGYTTIKKTIIKQYSDAIAKNKNSKLSHADVYNSAVKLVASNFGGLNSVSDVTLKANKTENIKIKAAPELISSIALQITEEVIFLKENKALNATLLQVIEKYISDELSRNLKNKKNVLQTLKNSNTPYNILRYYTKSLQDIKNSGVKDEDVTLKLTTKTNIQDSVKKAFIASEIEFFNQRSNQIEKYLADMTKNGKDGSPSKIMASALQVRQNAIKKLLSEISAWEEKERIIRNKLKSKAMETMDDMFRDEWAPRKVIMYFENRAYIGHFESFSYRRSADKPLINYDLKFVAEKQILGTLY